MEIRALAMALFSLFYTGVVESAPIEAYARLPLYENVSLSADGNYLAFITTLGDEREVVIQPLSSPNPTTDGARVSAGKQKLRDLYWIGNEQLVIWTSQSTDYLFGAQYELGALNNYDLKRKSAFSPMDWQREVKVAGALGPPQSRLIEGKPFLYTPGAVFLAGITHALVKSDLSKQVNKVADIAPIYENAKGYHWTVDLQGRAVTLSGYDEETQSWVLYTKKGDEWQAAHREKSPIETPVVTGLATEPGAVLVYKKENDQWVNRLFYYGDSKWGDALPIERCCIHHHLSDPLRHTVIGYSWMDSRRHYYFFDKSLQDKWQQVVQSFPGEELYLESWSGDLNKVVVRVFGKVNGSVFVLIDLQNKQYSRLGNFHSEIEPADIATVKSISFDAQDGLKIPGYLTLPNNKPAKNLPLIILHHGGLVRRHQLDYDWLAQALAAKGYLVLQPNNRGSWGISETHFQAGFGEFGRKMQTDLSDGAKALVKLGVADPQRICILGSGYGGYAALNGVVSEPDFYRCAISIAGTSDMRQQLIHDFGDHISKGSPRSRLLQKYFGVESLESAKISELSPAKYAAQIKAPILLIHGDNDSVVEIAQSKIMASALRKAKKPYEFVKLKSEDHWLSKSATRQQALQAVIKFLDAHNPP